MCFGSLSDATPAAAVKVLTLPRLQALEIAFYVSNLGFGPPPIGLGQIVKSRFPIIDETTIKTTIVTGAGSKTPGLVNDLRRQRAATVLTGRLIRTQGVVLDRARPRRQKRRRDRQSLSL
jgi:hypothetical protein